MKWQNISAFLFARGRQIFYIQSTGLKFVSAELNLGSYLSRMKFLFK